MVLRSDIQGSPNRVDIVPFFRSHLGIAFGHIVWEDYPENWPDLVDIVFEMISWPKDEYYLSTGLLGLIAITDVYL